MFGFIFRVVGFVVLALALVFAVLDITRSLTASELILTPLAQTWADISPQSLLTMRELVEKWTLPFFWDPVMTTVLLLPSWIVLWFIAMVLLKLSQKRETPYGRFASR